MASRLPKASFPASSSLPSLATSTRTKYIIGVCAMDSKARSKPMRNILNRLLTFGEFETVIFGDNVILDEDVENWPICDFFISFFSTGFPLNKAIEYVKLRKPFCVNDLPMQKLLWDRRLVLKLLDVLKIPTPKRLIVNRDGGPKIDSDLIVQVSKNAGIQLKEEFCPPDVVETPDIDTISVNGQLMRKPFVEKPVNGEDHNINIYYSSEMGGGGRRLFRKVANKASEFDPELSQPRTEGSFIYEEFMDVDNAEDVKVYTIGPTYAHAETRRSPVVDGHVKRNTDGKEVRYVATLTNEERKMAGDISFAFGQTVCGFDLLRVHGQSYVIDVNGWSFVKGNDDYYSNCARILRAMFLSAVRRRKVSIELIPNELRFENSWRLKSFIAVFRHADRTPKQKMKFSFRSKPFLDLLEDSYEEVMIPQGNLKKVSDAAIAATKLQLQIKPSCNKENGLIEKLQLIVKWGGEFTHAALYQSRDLGENLRKDLLIMNKDVLDDVKIYTSSERRVVATAEIFAGTFLDGKDMTENVIETRKEMLDDSNSAKEQMDDVKKSLKTLLKPNEPLSVDWTWPKDQSEPSIVVEEVIDIMKHLRQLMHENFEHMDYDNIQSRWCCSENPLLFKERWEKLFKDFCDVDRHMFDPSKISELYDSLKHDALHNRLFLETIFVDQNGDKSTAEIKGLYQRAKILFDFVAPQEYGIENKDKLLIGILLSDLLLKSILENLEDSKSNLKPCTRLYFTKESHVHSLLNVVFLSGLPTRIPRKDVPELDYLTQITFELYERHRGISGEKEYSLRVAFSPGAYSPNILDLHLDARHCLIVAPRKNLTDHLPLDEALSYYKTKVYSPPASVIAEPVKQNVRESLSSSPFFDFSLNYPFLIWNGSEPKEILTPNLDLQLQSSMAFSADGYDENANPELYQQCEVKVVALEYLSNHLKEELSLNNLRHRGNTWSAKPWTMFLQ
ncbi:2702_t:CDS:10 [Gigaspora margarita]|uniref:Inositol hexakisphosphate and diphosphoinositol-pentakisphosphate kinase n=1 Tax=Gigaspora margarita TaxID=4874 RepID=A0ABN7UQH2_GIGMA|nr:2702_t:CDS:10 [Gigaspora margarita]